MKELKAVDFFCGGGGMTCGMQQAGVEVIAGIDIDIKCRETFEVNNSPAKFIHADIKELELSSLEKTIGIQLNDDSLVFIGCSPCQYWSILKTNKSKSEESKNLLSDFQRFVEYYNPGYVVIENVPGIFFKLESPLKKFISFLKEKNYISIKYDIIKVFNYGIPQSRKRFVLIASRVKNLEFPKPEMHYIPTVREFIGDYTLFPSVAAGHKDESEFNHTVAGLSDVSIKRLELTPQNGGNRSAWKDTDLQINVYKRNEGSKNFGFKDIYGRMFWDKPAPTITTKFFGISHGRFGHPEQNRAISLREGATLQTFPNEYTFKTNSITDTARLIGNAVPPELSKRIGDALCESFKE